MFGSLVMIPAKYLLKRERVKNMDTSQINGYVKSDETNC